MAILTNSATLGSEQYAQQLFIQQLQQAMMSGLFGSMPAGAMTSCSDANTALIGWEKIVPATANHPSAVAQYGIIWSIDTMGCGDTGRRRIPVNTVMQEWIYQIALMNNNTVMMRQKINLNPWKGWVRWL
ncbi:hypothetical protein MX201_004037 [Salmonella enterica]|nr:hypothetical protein [Salmonella enterica]EGY4510554.1 hypothetical protein [Salmonella enterica]EGY4702747.1 hypothetical protein [Salmonella enterica]EHG4022270.1 hypothetical protein [Salmonella enterica]EHK3107683.1 hypothetical protein [Salmonella enterica]